jgi:PAS domain-containing protein
VPLRKTRRWICEPSIDTIPALVVCALPDGSVEFVNQAWREYTGSSLNNLTDWGWQTAIHPDDLSKFIDEWKTARAAGKPFQNEARIRRSVWALSFSISNRIAMEAVS